MKLKPVPRIEIMGSNLLCTVTGIPKVPIDIAPQVLSQTEALSWIGCPTALLQFIRRINSYASTSDPYSTAEITAIIESLMYSSPSGWLNSPPSRDTKANYHLVAIYHYAILIYAVRVLRSLLADDSYFTDMSQHVLYALSHLKDLLVDNQYFKGCTWPAFIIGLEVSRADHRGTIRIVFEALWEFWRCMNIKYAIQVLERTWASQPTYQVSSPGNCGNQAWLLI